MERRLEILEDSSRGMFITGATEVPVTSAKDALANYAQGVDARRTFETNMNVESSRSHAVFLLTVARFVKATNVTKYSQLYLVDLAGSEKVDRCVLPASLLVRVFHATLHQVWKTGAAGSRLEEAKYINKVCG
jgi:kinesin family member 5